jgi:hypothetical protein
MVDCILYPSHNKRALAFDVQMKALFCQMRRRDDTHRQGKLGKLTFEACDRCALFAQPALKEKDRLEITVPN